jgi:ribonuclease Y
VHSGLWVVLAGIGGFGVAWLISAVSAKVRGQTVQQQADRLLQEAQVERERMLRIAESDAKKTVLEVQREHEREVRKERDDIAEMTSRLGQQEQQLQRRADQLERRERDLKKKEATLQEQETQLASQAGHVEVQLKEAQRELERVSHLTREQAMEELCGLLKEEAKRSIAGQLHRMGEEARRTADEEATRVIASSIQRLASEFVCEKTITVVELESDEMKGRIIGREGRNIRAIEAATGVDIIVDDTPESVVLSAFNPVRREIAKIALERLMSDGRIHPARIEEVVEKAGAEVEQRVVKAGEQAMFDLGIHGMHPELVRLVGKLKWRNVGGQNLWNHSMETAYIAGAMAQELGLNPSLAKRAGILHDIGKALDHEVEGHHAHVGAEQARRYGEKPAVLQAIMHHHDASPPSVLATLVQAANVLSKQRPGARLDMLDAYIKRLEDLEKVCMSFKGVQAAFAVSAGREARVMVDYAKVNDDEAYVLCQDIACKIQQELMYPGDVRVTVVREARVTEIAR